MAVTPEEARRELDRRSQVTPEEARAELKRRGVSQPPTIFGGFPALGKTVAGLGDIGLTLGSGLLGRFAGGVAAAPVSLSDPEKSQQIFEKVSSGISVGPFTDVGKNILGSIAPAAEKLETGISDIFGALPGGPILQTIARTAVQAPLELLGLRGLTGFAKTPIKSAVVGPPAPPRVIPAVDDLFKSGSAAFERARRLGNGIKPESFQRFADRIIDLKEKSGLTVRINEKLHPQSHAVREEILAALDRGNGKVSFDDLVELRQIASDAAGTLDKADARIATILRKQIDSYVDSLGIDDVLGGNPVAAATSINEARGLWRRAIKGQTIEREIELAGVNANTFSGAGFENALRTQFKQLSRRIAKGTETGFTPAEVAMIRKVANGGTLDNLFRWVGKLAPTSVVSGGIGVGGGFALGGPVGAVAVPAIGLGSRAIATQRTISNAQNLSEAIRGGLLGLPIPPP